MLSLSHSHTHTHAHTHAHTHTHTHCSVNRLWLPSQGAFKGLTMFGEAMMSSVTGAKPSSAAKKSEPAVQPDNTYRPGIVSVVDLQKVNGDTVSIATQRERNVLFNDALNTFYLRLYVLRHMVKDHSDSEKGNPLLPHRLLLSINSKGSFICTIPQRG